MKELYEHNQRAVDAIKAHFAAGNRKAAVVHATGTGKSYIIAAVVEDYDRVLVIAPNNFVLDETRKVCHKGCEFRTYASVMYSEGEHEAYDIIVLDEFHRSGAEKWGAGVAQLIEANPQALLLGTSATHIRYLDNQRNMADELFDGQVVSHLSLKEAIDREILPNPTYVSSIYTMDETIRSRKQKIENCKKKNIDKEKLCRRLDGIAHNWDNAGGVPRIIRKYFRHDMQRIIVFCSKVKRASAAREMLSKWFGLAGFSHVRYYNIDYKEKMLAKEMADFQADMGSLDLKAAISVNMLNEGVHIPHVDGVIMLRSTISRIIIEQQVGRCLTSDNKNQKPVVLDLVNNMDLIKYDEPIDFGEWNGSRTDESRDSRNDNGFPFIVTDECRDMRVLLAELDEELNRVPSGYWTKETCIADARKYSTKAEWRENNASAYVTAKAHRWLKECCAHMTPLRAENGYWTRERCLERALKYTIIKDWRENDSRSYSAAKRYGYMAECTNHMNRMNSWTEDLCLADAKKYNNITDWTKNSSGAVDAARRFGIYEKCTAHMRTVYSLEDCINSACRYDTKNKWRHGDSKMYYYAYKQGWIKECAAALKTAYENRRKEECIASAKRYKTKKDWAIGDHVSYSYAINKGWYSDCCAHMTSGR